MQIFSSAAKNHPLFDPKSSLFSCQFRDTKFQKNGKNLREWGSKKTQKNEKTPIKMGFFASWVH
jgi:hypothetical protein